MIGLDQTATVYTRHTTTGLFTVVAQADLPCRLAHISRQPASGGQERAELSALRNMLWGPDYVMPELCQVEVGGVKWQPVKGTFGAPRGPMGTVVYRRCDVTRQSS